MHRLARASIFVSNRCGTPSAARAAPRFLFACKEAALSEFDGRWKQFSTTSASAETMEAIATEPIEPLPLDRGRRRPLAQEIWSANSAVTLLQNNLCDKILIFINHGEDESKISGSISAISGYQGYRLTRRGVGQALSLSRKMALLCNQETKFIPELVASAPLHRSLQTALIALPQYSPTSVKCIEWVCNDNLLGIVAGGRKEEELRIQINDVKACFPGVCFTEQGSPKPSLGLLERTDQFLEWIKGRDERIIVVSSESVWLEVFCEFTLDFNGNVGVVENGVEKIVAIKF